MGGRPDFGMMQRQQRTIASYVGETATLQHYVSASAGNPAYGIGDEPCYVTLTMTGLFVPVLPEEIQAAGGLYLVGDVRITPMDVSLQQNDLVVWRGAAHLVISDPIPQPIVNGHQRVLLRRGGATA